jgi:hypothetical protein
MTKERSVSNAVILGAGAILAAAVFGLFFYASRGTESTVRVVGSATRRVDSDISKLRLSVITSVGPSEIRKGYAETGRDVTRLKNEILRKGFSEGDIELGAPSAFQTYDQQGGVRGHQVQQTLVIVSARVEELQRIAFNPDQLIGEDIGLQSISLEYFHSRIADIKKELLAEATSDARKRAEEIVRESGLSVVGLVSARSGVFQITEPYSTEVTDYGVYSTSSRKKDVTVTVTVTFLVE